MRPANGEYRSAVYTNRPPYADYDPPRKFMAIFGDSYRYRQQYNEYKQRRMADERAKRKQIFGQVKISDLLLEDA